jgi:type II secretory pathway predicted ATPase ExeA/septal ring-binding cell division protein DamX
MPNYIEQLNLSHDPFAPGVDSKPFLDIADRRDILENVLESSLYSNGITAIYGPLGAGKTMLADALEASFGEEAICVHLRAPALSVEESLLKIVADRLALQIDADTASPLSAIAGFVRTLETEARVLVLMIDDAEQLTESQLDALRKLNQSCPDSAVHTIVFGEPELEAMIADSQPAAQAGGVNYLQLAALDQDQIGSYLLRKLEKAGWHRDSELLDSEPVKGAIAEATGVPGAIDTLASKALIAFLVVKAREEEADALDQVNLDKALGGIAPVSGQVEELEDRQEVVNAKAGNDQSPIFRVAGMVLLAGLVTAIVWYMVIFGEANSIDESNTAVSITPAPSPQAMTTLQATAPSAAEELVEADDGNPVQALTTVNPDEPAAQDELLESVAARSVNEALDLPSSELANKPDSGLEAEQQPELVAQTADAPLVLSEIPSEVVSTAVARLEEAASPIQTDSAAAVKQSLDQDLSASAEQGSSAAQGSAEPEKTVSDATEPSLAGLSGFEAELMARAPRNFTIQVLGSRSESRVREFMGNFNDIELAGYIETRYRDKAWFVVIVGDYPNLQLAATGLESFAPSLTSGEPWVRPFADIQASIRQFRSAEP